MTLQYRQKSSAETVDISAQLVVIHRATVNHLVFGEIMLYMINGIQVVVSAVSATPLRPLCHKSHKVYTPHQH